MHISKYFYSLYNLEDEFICTYDSISEILINIYQMKKTDVNFRKKYIKTWWSIQRSPNHTIKLKKYNYKIYRFNNNE